MRADAADADRVAIGRRLGDHVRADVAARAGAVLDEDRLAPGLGPAIADQTRIDVGDAAHGKRHDDPDRLGWVDLRACGESNKKKQQKPESNCGHGISPALRKCFWASAARPSCSASRASSRWAARDGPNERLASR